MRDSAERLAVKANRAPERRPAPDRSASVRSRANPRSVYLGLAVPSRRAASALQRTFGNDAMRVLLDPEEASSPVVRIHRMAASAGRPGVAGTHRLVVSSPQDELERQADAMASRALSAPASACHCGAPNCECAHRKQGPTIWRKSLDSPGAASPPPSLLGGALTGGRVLDDSTRGAMERRFGHDFSHVRIHTGARADAAARAVEAVALTTRSHVAFREGAYAPGTSTGDRLLAHELAHVVQEDHGLGRDVLHRSQHDDHVALDDPAYQRGGDIVDPLERSEGVRLPEPTAQPERETLPERPARGSQHMWFRDVLLSDDRDFMRAEIVRLFGRSGIEGADEWHAMLHGWRPFTVGLPFSAHARAYGGLRPRTAMDVARESSDQALANQLRPVASEVFGEVRREAVEFLRQFEERARQTTLEILRESELRVEAERMRYGLQREQRWETRYHRDEFGVRVPEPHLVTSHSMATNVSSRGLAGAARDLRDKRNEINRAAARQASLVRHIVSHVVVRTYVPPENAAEHERLGRELVELRRQYDVLRATYESRYPILASYGDDPDAIARVAGGPSPETAAVLNEQIYDKLEKIQQVRDGLNPGGRVKVWKLPEIVSLTKLATDATPGTWTGAMRSRIVDDEARRIRERDTLIDIALAVLAIGLAIIAAIPTGGSSLAVGVTAVASIASLGLSAYQVAEHVQQYQIESAMAGSDFDKARAISASEPSLFWLAVDILGAALDVGPALRGTRQLLSIGQRSFQRLAPAVQEALRASGPDAGRKLEELRRLATETEHGGAGLARRLAARVEQLRDTSRTVERTIGRAAGHEARAVREAGAALAREAASPLAQAPTRLGGHTIKVTPSGWLVRCTVCGGLRETYAVELVRNHTLALRLLDLEDMAARAARAGDRALAQRAADGAQALEVELQAARRARDVRLYRGLRPGALDDMFLMDRRLVVDMEFVGRGVRGATSAGWERNAQRYWEVMIARHPEAFSDANIRRIRGTPPLARPYAPVNDTQFRSVFTQYDVRGLRGKPLVHHHIGGGGQAAAIPAPLHPGSGGIHNVERAAGIWRGEDPIADMLERLLASTEPPP